MYTDLPSLKLSLGITTSDQDALLTMLILEAQSVIDNYCRQSFEVATDTTRYFDPTLDSDDTTLWLDAPLCAITSVTNGNGVVVSAGQYTTWPRNSSTWYRLVLKSNSGIAWTYSTTPENSIAIVGKWAYSQSAPVAVQRATHSLVETAYNRQGKGGYSKMRVEDLEVTLSGGETAQSDLMADLRPYRRLI